ncbi:lytic transglycosylase domain-containing protein [Dyella tabacisoli]|uniref:Lytic transglycosylase domain-containing protein n=1 Tax=Dyella tabacisoli TaxID=2282381 RepID=A0A369UVY2_9GAMM|nr:lytic transglycosylase domain-containing protein [Dyella tabacisoli]RDD82509.1 lytic transglycosylase domain-containing protein [Dyella tabacisoli]
MSVAISQQAVNHQRGQRLYWAIAGCALLAGLLGYSPAHARGLYRCTGGDGETVFSNNTAGYKDCHKLSETAEAAPSRQSKIAVPAIASVLGVRGSAETTARALPPELPLAIALGAVVGSVETTARIVDAAPVPSAKPGQWSYSESRKALDDASAAASAPVPAGDRVLRGAVYRVVRADGSVEYTNLRPAGQPGRAVTMLFSYISTCMACNLHSPIHWDSVSLNLTAYADTIRAASVQFGVDEAFLRAIIHAESAFNPRALSIKGAQGLMQLMPATAGDMGVHDAFDADQNILGGARYLALLLKNFNGDERLAAAAYNAGANAVLRYNGVPPYAETQVYVERVGALRKRYGAVAKPPLASALTPSPGKNG